MDNVFKEEKLLLAVARALPDPIFIIDRQGTYLQVLGGSERSLYDSGRHLVGMQMQDVLPGDKAGFFLGIIAAAIDTKQLQVHEYSLSPSDFNNNPGDGPEGEQWFQSRVYPIELEENEIPAVVLLVINITERKIQEEELRRLSITDTLTGTNNRRFFLQALGEELDRVQRYRSPAALLLVDVDGFKGVNDTYGHASGDRALIHIVRHLEKNLRKSDIVGRLGGDELAVLLPSTDREHALYVADKLVSDIDKSTFSAEGKDICLTISIGWTEIAPEDETVNQILSRADEALYQAKRGGRNRAVEGFASGHKKT